MPDMQGDGEDNHMDGDKGARRWGARAKCLSVEGQGHRGWRWLGVVKEQGDGLYLPKGAGSQVAAAGRMVGWEAKAKTRSCPGQIRSRR